MRGHIFSGWKTWIFLTILMVIGLKTIAIAELTKHSDLKLKDGEIGTQDARGYTFGSSMDLRQNGEFVEVVHRLFNGSQEISTIEWHSAALRETFMQSSESREQIIRSKIKGIRGSHYLPIPFDPYLYDKHSATIETQKGKFYIDNAPAFQPQRRVQILEFKYILEQAFEIVWEIILKSLKGRIKFESYAKGSQAGFEYFSRIQNFGEGAVYIQWLGLSSKNKPYGVITKLPGKMQEPQAVSEGKSNWPIHLVNDVAFINTESEKSLPGDKVSYLDLEPNFDKRRQDISKLELGNNTVMIVPAIVRIDQD